MGRTCSTSVGSGVFTTNAPFVFVQQETDINYSLFKSVVWRNLAKKSTTCFAKGITMSLENSTFGLIVYGGVCPDSGITLENTFESMFDKVSNTHLWSEVSVVPFTKKYLINKKVCHDVTDKDNPNFDVFQDNQSQNRGDALSAIYRG
jgi:hypothetical protein